MSKLINARSESDTEKPSFRSSASNRRTIVPANGYYEWMKSEEGEKIPLPEYGSGQWMRGRCCWWSGSVHWQKGRGAGAGAVGVCDPHRIASSALLQLRTVR